VPVGGHRVKGGGVDLDRWAAEEEEWRGRTGAEKWWWPSAMGYATRVTNQQRGGRR
jgi:hypothetical protein